MESKTVTPGAGGIPVEQGNEYLEVRQSAIHGTGGYARRDISAGMRVVEYVGERITKAESDRRCEANNEYIFIIDDDWDLDGLQSWNPARFINHSCAPNCEAEWDGDRLFIVALRDIKQGEELSFNYGYDLENYEDHKCHCRTPQCVGYILAEEYWEQVRKPVASAKVGA
jgi:SET domain-containing protein